jgi:molybdate transport system substrate-binding protein
MGIVRQKTHNEKKSAVARPFPDRPQSGRGKGWLWMGCVGLFFFWIPVVLAAEIRISAAASTKDVMTEAAKTYEKKNPSASIVDNFGASGALAKQIENGAPTDIFVSANRDWVDYLAKKKFLVPEKIRPFAYNTLVFVGKGQGKGFPDLVNLGRIAIASPRSAPAGAYAMEALKKSGWLSRLQKKLIQARDVREALAYAERGEVDGAFVYQTDALLAKEAKILFVIPVALHAPILYPLAMTLRGSAKEGASAYYQFLQGDEVRGILKRYGFTVPPAK